MGLQILNCIFCMVILCLSYPEMNIAKERSQYDTAYACDGKMLKIECKDGYVINLIRANYGRYSITVCNDHGSTDWSVNCMSHRSFPILQSRCNLKRNCTVQASANLFYDPCPGTVKYLEAHYLCELATSSSSTTRPSPPWLMTSPPNIFNTAKPLTVNVPSEIIGLVIPTVYSTTSATSSTKSQSREVLDESIWETTVSSVPPVVIESSSESELIHITNNEISSSSTEITQILESESKPLCKPITARNLFWNWTVGGDVSIQPCPGGAAGLARWRCQTISPNLAIRFPDTPDLSECRSMWLTSLETRITEGDSLTKIASELCQVTESKILLGGDMFTSAKIIRDMAQKMAKDIQTFPDLRQREAIVYDLLQSVAKVGSNLLDISQQPSWRDLSHKEQMRVATSLLVGLEENSFLLADTTKREKIITHCTKNMLLSVQVLEMRNVINEVFPNLPVIENCSLRVNNWLQLQRSALLENHENGLVRLVYIAFDTLEFILKAQPNSKEEKRINSKILSASLGKGRHIQLIQPVVLCLQHLVTENVSNPTCVFWDYTQSIWSEEGCTLVSTNSSHTICRCNHLTNFAILVDIKTTHFAVHSVSLPVMIVLIIVVLILSVVTIVLIIKFVRNRRERKALPIHYNSPAMPYSTRTVKLKSTCGTCRSTRSLGRTY